MKTKKYIEKQEKKYIDEIFNQLTKNFNDNSLSYCERAFTKFAKNIEKDEIDLLRKGEVFLRRVFI